jgi:hypothetical protein
VALKISPKPYLTITGTWGVRVNLNNLGASLKLAVQFSKIVRKL